MLRPSMYDILDEMVHKGLLDEYNVGTYCVYGVYGMDKTKALRKEIIKIINSMNEQRLEILLAKLIWKVSLNPLTNPKKCDIIYTTKKEREIEWIQSFLWKYGKN